MSQLIRSRAIALAIGHSLDRFLGEPPDRFHPMVYSGRALAQFEKAIYADSRTRGTAYLITVLTIGGLGSVSLRRLLGKFGFLTSAVALSSASGMLTDEALTVHSLIEANDLDAARLRLRSLVGRDSRNLDEQDMARAVIESLAENTVDAVLSTLFWGGLLGGTGAIVHRLANTLDAMIGHRSEKYERFGWASAKLDDYLNWVPARLGALAVVLSHPTKVRAVIRAITNDSHQHPSPNGGVIEAAYAGALGLTLGGQNEYGGLTQDRGTLGDGLAPTRLDIRRAVELSRSISTLLAYAPVAIVVLRLTAVRLASRQAS